MKRPTRSAAVGLAAALGLTIAAIPGVVSAAGDEPSPPPPVPFVSTLTLNTAVAPNTPQLTLEGTTLTQELKTANPSLNNCNLVTEPSLLAFKGFLGVDPKPAVGFKNGSLGVNEKIESVCNRVDALSATNQVETLEISLNPSIEVVNTVPVLGASSASLDIEVTSIRKSIFSAWQKAVVEAVAYPTDGSTPVTVELKQGADGCAVPPPGSTSRMDSSNCRLNITMDKDKYFTRLTLTAKAGGFSLEGGSDPVAPATTPATYYPPTTFDLVTLVDKEFSCAGGESTTNNAKVVYIGTAGDPDACEAFGIRLDATAEEVVFLKPLGVDPDAQFIFDVTWTKARTEDSPVVTIPTAEIDFEFVEAEAFRKMAFCPPSLYSITTGQLIGLAPNKTEEQIKTALGGPNSDLEPAPGVQFACIDQGRTVVYGKDTIEVTDKIYLIGDAKMRL